MQQKRIEKALFIHREKLMPPAFTHFVLEPCSVSRPPVRVAGPEHSVLGSNVIFCVVRYLPFRTVQAELRSSREALAALEAELEVRRG